MHYLVAAAILIAIFYYAWPLLLALALISAALFWYQQKMKAASLYELNKVLPGLRADLAEANFVSDAKKCHFSRIREILIAGSLGGEALKIIVESVFWDDSMPTNIDYKYRSISQSFSIKKVTFSDSGFSAESIYQLICRWAEGQSLRRLDPGSFDSRICSLVFMNYAEAAWGDDALRQIEESLNPLREAYNASLTNELLAGGTRSLEASISALEAESRLILDYVEELYDSLRKCSEFLMIPMQLRSLVSLDTRSLEAFARRDDMRRSFEEVVSIKHEYDELRSASL
jgi:hypothetical protein